MRIFRTMMFPLTLSLSKGRPYFQKEGQGFDRLSPSG